MECRRVLRESGGPVRVRVGSIVIGEKPVLVAGPCSVEDRDMIVETAVFLRRVAEKHGVGIVLRGGVWKPRTSPYSFQGHGIKALEWLREAGDAAGLPVATEVMDPRLVGVAAEYADVLWVGARSMQNTPLLRELARVDKPVMVKRHFGATIGEWLCAAEYLLAEGKEDVVLVERGIRGINEYARFVLDLTVVPLVKGMARLPLVVDVSHPAGRRDIVAALARGVMAAGADGVMVEVHPRPEKALSDSRQQLGFEEFESLVASLKGMGLV